MRTLEIRVVEVPNTSNNENLRGKSGGDIKILLRMRTLEISGGDIKILLRMRTLEIRVVEISKFFLE